MNDRDARSSHMDDHENAERNKHLRMLVAVSDILRERERQVQQEGWTADHDDYTHRRGQLALAAACYAAGTIVLDPSLQRPLWPWHRDWWKPTTRRRDLVKAGALIVAEIERLDRAPASRPEHCEGRSP